MTDLIIYRTCDRPIYTDRSFPHLIEHSSVDSFLVFIENSADPQNIERNTALFHKYADTSRMAIKVYGERIGVNKPIPEGIKFFKTTWPKHKLNHIAIADDDVLVPESEDKWDSILFNMLDNERFDFVGFCGWPISQDKLGSNIKAPFMSGACSAFKYEHYRKNPLTQYGIFAYNQWSSKKGRCSRYTTTNLTYKNMDKDFSLNMSLRGTEYVEYSADIDNLRRPKKKK